MEIEAGTQVAIRRWLYVVCGLLVAMISVGGITRLTGSGLSIVEWRPVTGALPPLGARAWADTFAAYQRSPQYRLVNPGMSLEAFKAIYFWEYCHRLLGRIIGLVVALPLAALIVRRKLARGLALRLGAILVLGGAQGALGWFMVKSGLVERPWVSHLRLAAHLCLALALLGAILWTALEIGERRAASRPHPSALGLLALVFLQIVYGAFTAGLHAGAASSTFPSWNGHLAPPDAVALSPAWRNLVFNPSTVQYTHRVIGALVLLAVLSLVLAGRRLGFRQRARSRVRWLLLVTLAQVSLGALTVTWHVPLVLAALHQLGGCAVFLLTVAFLHATPFSLSGAEAGYDESSPVTGIW